MQPENPKPSQTPADDRPRWMRWLGLRRREGQWIRFAPTRWGVTLMALGFIGANLGFMEYSMQPNFCRSCHVMEPYFQAWQESTHQNLTCVQCHITPGLAGTIKAKLDATTQLVKYVTGTYGSKPHAEVHDVSCLRSGCHVREELPGMKDWTVQSAGSNAVTIRFDHGPHLDKDFLGKKLRCVSCHSQIERDTHMAVSLDGCFLCHLKNTPATDQQVVENCTTCHDSPKDALRLTTGEFLHQTYIERGVSCQNCHSDVIGGHGEVPRQFCWSCHNRPEEIARYNEPELLHEAHVTKHKVECISCHERIVHHLNAATPPGPFDTFNSGYVLASSGGCGSCHDKMHNASLAIYSGTGGLGVEDMPSPMYRAQVDCVACHRPATPAGHAPVSLGGYTHRASAQACDYCHHDEYPGRLDEWRTTIQQRLAEAQTIFSQAQAAFDRSKLQGDARRQAQQWIDEAAHNLRLVESGRGVHNINYATALLSLTIDHSRQILAATPQAASPSAKGQ